MTIFTSLDDAPSGTYRLIAADPPWHFKSYSGDGGTPTQKGFRCAEADHYSTMPLRDIAALPVQRIAAPDALLAMWVVGSHIEQAIELGQTWGFAYVTDLFWWLKTKMVNANQICLFTGDVPQPGMSMGYHSRKQGEQVLLFRRGKGLPVLRRDVRQIITEPRREHSRKPDCFFDRIEQLYGSAKDTGPRIELFARETRKDWDSFGNQIGILDAATEVGAT